LASTIEDAGISPTLIANDGRVVILGEQSLLEGRFTGAGARQLLLYGKRGTNYTLQSRTGFGAGSSWANRITITVTNVPHSVTPPSAALPIIYFRVRE
jgi:hypothetical protein